MIGSQWSERVSRDRFPSRIMDMSTSAAEETGSAAISSGEIGPIGKDAMRNKTFQAGNSRKGAELK